jgi:hypothetical protein
LVVQEGGQLAGDEAVRPQFLPGAGRVHGDRSEHAFKLAYRLAEGAGHRHAEPAPLEWTGA